MHLDDRDHEAGDVGELAHVDGEVLELVLLRLLQHQARAVAHCIDAPQVACRVEGWVRGARQRHVWEAGGPRAVGGGGARGAQRAIGRVGLAAARRDGGLGALAVEQTHGGGQEQSRRQVQGGGGRQECRRENAGGAPAEEIWKTGTVCRGRAEAIHSSSKNEPRISWRSLQVLATDSQALAFKLPGGFAGGAWDRADKETGTDRGRFAYRRLCKEPILRLGSRRVHSSYTHVYIRKADIMLSRTAEPRCRTPSKPTSTAPNLAPGTAPRLRHELLARPAHSPPLSGHSRRNSCLQTCNKHCNFLQ
jgi:hypothetical protein